MAAYYGLWLLYSLTVQCMQCSSLYLSESILLVHMYVPCAASQCYVSGRIRERVRLLLAEKK